MVVGKRKRGTTLKINFRYNIIKMRLKRTRYNRCYKQVDHNTRIVHKYGYEYILVRVFRNEICGVPDPIIFGMKGWALKSCTKIKPL